MMRNILLMAILLLFPCTQYADAPSNAPVEFVVVVPSYNNEKYCIGNLESIFNQTYPYFTVYYINDCSTDKTGQQVDDYIKSRKLEHKCTVVHNETRKGALANLYNTIIKIEPHKVVVSVDGDDRLANSHALEVVASVYADKNVWMTYGDYVFDPLIWTSNNNYIPESVAKTRGFRSHPWVTSHLRTFYAKLFQNIEKEDLLLNGQFYQMAWDLAMMFPMLEMASQGHFRFIPQALYIYNAANPLNDFRVNNGLQVQLENHLRNKPAYPALEQLF